MNKSWIRSASLIVLFSSIGFSVVFSQESAQKETSNKNLTKIPKFNLENVRRITEFNRYTHPVWSRNKPSILAFIGHDGTFIISPSEGKIKKISTERAGFKFSWTKDGKALFFRARVDEQRMAIKLIEIETGGVSILLESSNLGIPHQTEPGSIQFRDADQFRSIKLSRTSSVRYELPFAYQLNDQILVVAKGITKQITTTDGKYFLPEISPDGTKVLYQEISRGIYVTELQNNKIFYLGNGDDPAWSPDSKHIIYEITTDDGHSIMSSELYIASLDRQKIQLTNTYDLLEMRPSWSMDGKFIAYEANGGIFIAEIVFGR